MTDDALSDDKNLTPTLEHAQEPEHLLASLKKFGFLDQDIAEGTGSDERTVRRWKKQHPGAKAAKRLAEIRNIVVLLREEETLSDRGVIFWMRHPNRLLEDFSPLLVVSAGGFRPARDAARCFADPDRRFEQPLPAPVLKRLEGAVASARDRNGKGAGKRKRLEPVGS
jgi:hypothetical protein